MKKIIVAVAILMAVTVNAQTTTSPPNVKEGTLVARKSPLTAEERVDMRIKRLTADLSLNEKQQADVKKVLLTAENDRQKVVEENRANRKAGIKLTEQEKDVRKIKALEQKIALDKEMKKILTDEQFKKYEQQKEVKKADLKTMRTKKDQTVTE
jgi:protein CpxP